MSHYDDVLKELKEKGQKLANQYIVDLYTILRDEEKLPPQDCRARIERDCLDLWSKATIRKYLPPEAMNPKKQIAGKLGADEKKKKKNEEDAMLVITATGGGNETIPNAQLNESFPVSQKEEDPARTNLAEDVSVSQKEEESRSFHNDVDQQLSSRTISPALLEANSIIAEKDRKIEELNRLLNESRRQSSSSTTILLLPNNLTKLIRQFPSTDFILKHNGYEVTSVQPARKDEMSEVATAMAAACLSQTGTSNNNQIKQESQDDSSTIHQQYKYEAVR